MFRLRFPRRVAQVNHRGALSPPPIFELSQPFIGPVGTPHIKLPKALGLGIFDGFPKQQLHAAQSVKSLVREAVLIGHSLPMSKRQNSRRGLSGSEQQPKLQRVTHAIDQVAKPPERLWRQFLPSTSQGGQPIELL